ncbi:hypothetical protein AYY18_14145 [Morganella psychrotolerans]|uniref:Tail fiber protein n=2 Tax=Morganella psychrotolerans TaxID=368603 RepID=A0A1B8HT13_9GAMM|nr:hypothetical protein AYY18_14145 [Morganella psychrotolerans]
MKNPKLIVKPFAKNGQKNVIPENYETSMEGNQATWDQGFGQITMLPVAAGGLPPKGQDFNGIFNQLSENIVYLSQGGRFKFSAEYAESIGGYPKGAILQSDDEKKEYQSLIGNNKVNFNVAPDISASWEVIGGSYATKAELTNGLNKKVNTSDVSQTLGNDLTKLPSLDLVTRELGKKASTADVNGKLAKDQNGADIPDKTKFIENLGLGDSAHLLSDGNQVFKSGVSSEQSLGVKKGTVFIETSIAGNTHPVTKLKRNTGSEIEVLWPSESGKILIHKDIEKITPKVGEFNQSPFRASELSSGWYSCNGDLYDLTSPQGQALNSLSANYKIDWGIKVSNGKINMPTPRQTDGKTAILRPVNGTARLPGSVEGDAMRRLQGDFYARGVMQADGKRSSVGAAWGKNASLFSNASRSTDEQAIMLNTIADYKYEVVDRVMFDTQNAVPSSDEFRMLNMGVTLTMYLGV